jgi:methionine-gamma-lyase
MAGAVVGSRERIRQVRAAQIDTGATLAPFSAFLVLRGIATLPVRMERQTRTALALAAFFEGSAAVARVIYPGLASHPQARAAGRILDAGGAMLAVELAGGREAGRIVFDTLRIPERTASLGSVHTMVVHPPTSSHRALSSEQLAAAGITEGLLRISVGLEDEADLLADFGAALEAASEATAAAANATSPAGANAAPDAPTTAAQVR